jgi:hypothetical protein
MAEPVCLALPQRHGQWKNNKLVIGLTELLQQGVEAPRAIISASAGFGLSLLRICLIGNRIS